MDHIFALIEKSRSNFDSLLQWENDCRCSADVASYCWFLKLRGWTIQRFISISNLRDIYHGTSVLQGPWSNSNRFKNLKKKCRSLRNYVCSNFSAHPPHSILVDSLCKTLRIQWQVWLERVHFKVTRRDITSKLYFLDGILVLRSPHFLPEHLQLFPINYFFVLFSLWNECTNLHFLVSEITFKRKNWFLLVEWH